MKITSKVLRKMWLDYYVERGHKIVPAVSLIGDGDTGVMFNVAGMQPLMPFLLGKTHPLGTRLCNVQGCIRTNDIESVGDCSHLTFFEMMGNWSLGDYFKKEKVQWTFDLLTKHFGLDADKIHSTCYQGDENVPKDTETFEYLVQAGIKKENIHFLPKEDNWWDLPGTVNTPCGPDNEWFYPLHDNACGENCGPACGCDRFVEIGNDVYMQYEQLGGGKYRELDNKNVDTGFGFERNLIYLNGLDDVYDTDCFSGVIAYIEKHSNIKYKSEQASTKNMRIVTDHIRTAVMLLGDVTGCTPSNVGAGYILRRLIRRAVRCARALGLNGENLIDIANIYICDIFDEAYPLLKEKQNYIIDELKKEFEKFGKTLISGEKEFEKVVAGLERKREFLGKSGGDTSDCDIISGKAAFRLFDTFGYPLEMTVELANEAGKTVDEKGFAEAFEQHRELARTTSAGKFKGGLADDSEATVHLHTAAHLTLAAMQKVLNEGVTQKGSNITSERLRFDFNFDRKMTDEEVAAIEAIVNDAIGRDIEAICESMSLAAAREKGAHGVFDNKYGDVVKVYTIGDVSCEICGGPHAGRTGEMGKFKIVKQESCSAGVRRIKATLTK